MSAGGRGALIDGVDRCGVKRRGVLEQRARLAPKHIRAETAAAPFKVKPGERPERVARPLDRGALLRGGVPG